MGGLFFVLKCERTVSLPVYSDFSMAPENTYSFRIVQSTKAYYEIILG